MLNSHRATLTVLHAETGDEVIVHTVPGVTSSVSSSSGQLIVVGCLIVRRGMD